ncbi:MAG: GNAT family N-acetyltransferase [Methanobacteriota archaeon]|nr:MAG: GNAT family N-acetyltransferase [Euryarchaeota archaeon]TLZ67925.1 MAG: GNAT family N-acetyltransferase [Euryarchaeota archaeon]
MRMDTSRFPQTSNDWKPARPSASRSSDFRGGRPSHGTILSARHRFRLSQGNAYRVAGCRPRPMVLVERANPTDRLDVERLIAAYLTSESVKPRPERITWAVEQVMKNRVGGVVLVAREKKAVVGVALAVYSPSAEEGRLLVLNDFFVDPLWRRKGVGRALATRLLEEAKAMRVERIDLEVTPTNANAAAFWKSMGFRTGGRTVYGRDIL